jgi:PAS domain S-box-containing protein
LYSTAIARRGLFGKMRAGRLNKIKTFICQILRPNFNLRDMPVKEFSLDYPRLFEMSPGAFIVLLPDLTVAAVTDEYLRSTMVRREVLIGRNIFDVFPDNSGDGSHQKQVRDSFLKVFESSVPDELPIQKYDVQRPAEDGGAFEERFWRLITFPGAVGARGEILYVIHRVEDITESVKSRQKEDEQEKLNAELYDRARRSEREREEAIIALEDAQMRLEAALEAGEIGTWTWDILSNRVVADENLARFFSVSKADAAGGQIEKYITAVHPDDVARVGKLITETLASGESYEAEYRLLKPDGSIRWVVARGRVVRDETGKALQLPGVVIDITSRKQAQNELRESQTRLAIALQAGRAGTFEWDIKNNVNLWSPELEELYGVPAGTFEGNFEAWSKRVVPEDVETVSKGLQAAIENAELHYDYEFRAILPTGAHRWFAGRARFEYDAQNQPLRMIGINIDITDRKLIESEREHLLRSEKDARAEAELANRLKDDFLATLSHELRTPLTSILGWSRMLKDGELEGERARRAVETIERNAKAQSQLIEDILDVSRIISGKMRIDARPVELASIIETAIESVRPAAEAKNIRLQRVADSNVMISGDADRLQQIVWNLLSNAIKFTPKNGRVQIKLERVNSHVEITVADNGIGIDAATLPFVFERFRQSDSSTTRKHGGLGLGLAIVRHLVELHGGTVQVASGGLNQGAVFTVAFPLLVVSAKESESGKEGDQAADTFPAGIGSISFTCPPQIKDLRVLLVDDEPDTREILMFIFEHCQARVTVAGSVAEALEIVQTDQFDILVSDIGMPDRDGYDLIKNIRELAPESGGRMPAVALTAYARTEDRMKVLAAGFQMHVPKPVEPAELLAVVASLTNGNRY